MTFKDLLRQMNNIIFPLLMSCSVLIFLGLNGTLNSGYHFVDDHEIIRINNDLQNESLVSVVKKWVGDDLNIRFRPLYFVHRVLTTRLFGTNFLYLALYTGILSVITFLSLIVSLRKLNFSSIESLIFLIITFIGPQFSIWWRLGPNETLGITMISISFLFMSKCLNKRRYFINNALFFLFLILSSLCKESFLLIVPGIILFKFLNEIHTLNISFNESLRRNLLSIIPLLIIIIELYIIVEYVGLNQVGYAGVDLNLRNTLIGIRNVIVNLRRPYLLLIEWAVILLLLKMLISNNFEFKRLIPPLILSILIVIPNIILYAKSGMWERYFLPTSFGIAFLIISIMKANGGGLSFMKLVLLSIVIWLYIPIINRTFEDVQSFENEGIMLKSLIENTLNHHTDNSKTLVVVDPVRSYEKSYSLKVYLGIDHNIDLYGYAFEDESLSEEFRESLINGWYHYFENRTYYDLESDPDEIIFLDKSLIDKFYAVCKLNKNDYKNVIPENDFFALLINCRE